MSQKQIAAILVLAAIATQALAWGPEGHQITAEIAQRHLTPAAAKACREALGGKDPADVANWADEVRSDAKYAYLKAFHFARVPKGSTYKDSQKPPGGDVIMAAEGLANYLKTGDESALDKVKALDQLTKIEALKAEIHFIGDIHQPLHISDPADFGGNNVKVTFKDPKTGELILTELHSVIDGRIINAQGLDYKAYAEKIDHASTADIEKWQNFDYSSWAEEGVVLRMQFYNYPDPQPAPKPDEEVSVLISTQYIKNNLPIIENQLLKGGIRLAGIINWIFDSQDPKKN